MNLYQTYKAMKKDQWGAFQDGQDLPYMELIEYELWNAKRYFIDDNDSQMEEWIFNLENKFLERTK